MIVLTAASGICWSLSGMVRTPCTGLEVWRSPCWGATHTALLACSRSTPPRCPTRRAFTSVLAIRVLDLKKKKKVKSAFWTWGESWAHAMQHCKLNLGGQICLIEIKYEIFKSNGRQVIRMAKVKIILIWLTNIEIFGIFRLLVPVSWSQKTTIVLQVPGDYGRHFERFP